MKKTNAILIHEWIHQTYNCIPITRRVAVSVCRRQENGRPPVLEPQRRDSRLGIGNRCFLNMRGHFSMTCRLRNPLGLRSRRPAVSLGCGATLANGAVTRIPMRPQSTVRSAVDGITF